MEGRRKKGKEEKREGRKKKRRKKKEGRREAGESRVLKVDYIVGPVLILYILSHLILIIQ